MLLRRLPFCGNIAFPTRFIYPFVFAVGAIAAYGADFVCRSEERWGPRKIAESAGKPRNDRSLELKHAGDTTAVIIKTLDFSPLLEFLVATIPIAPKGAASLRHRQCTT